MTAERDPRVTPSSSDGTQSFGEDPELPPHERGTTTAEPVGVERAVEQLIEETGLETQPQPLSLVGGLRGRVAIVTGGSSGIGRAVVHDLARCGVHVAFCYLDEGSRSRVEAQNVLRELLELEVRTVCATCDVRDPAAVRDFVAQAHEELGGLHILVNNAGIGRDGALWRMDDIDWDVVVRTNLDGAFFFTRACAPYFRAQEYGKIVNIASVHGSRPEFGLANYAASKAGLEGLTRAAAVELGPKNINVNAVAPSYIRTTRLTDRVPAEILDRARERSVLGRLGDPQDVASVVLFLCSEAARHITGAVVPVDGGYLL
jgi:3-oxoacyl-[acyl-carrier protein] reductase